MKAVEQVKQLFAESKARHQKKVDVLAKHMRGHDFMVIVDAFREVCLSFECLYFDESEERQMQEAHADRLAKKLDKLRKRKERR